LRYATILYVARLTRRGLILRGAPVLAGAAVVGTRPAIAAEEHHHGAGATATAATDPHSDVHGGF